MYASLIWIFFGCARPPTLSPAQQQSELKRIFERHIAAIGGEQALRSHTARTMKGTMRVPGAKRAHSVNLQQRAPDHYYLWINVIGEGVFERGHTGELAWERTPRNTRKLSEEERKANRQVFDFHSELNYASWVESVQSVGTEKFGDQLCDVIDITNYLGEKERLFFNQDSGRKVGRVKEPGTNEERIIRFGQYLQRDGVFTAMSVEERIGDLRKIWIYDELLWDNTDADFGTPSFLNVGPQ